jgi:adenylosuccinate lyase
MPDATGLLHFMLSDMAWVMQGLHVDPERMLANLGSTGGSFFSQKVLTALVDHGMARDIAYEGVQRAANDTWERGLQFKERMWEEIANAGVLSEGEFVALFRVEPYLSNLGGVFERLEKLPVEEM